MQEESFWPGKSYDYRGYIDIVVWGKLIDGRRPNILRVDYLQEVERINQFILKNISVEVVSGNQTFNAIYRDLCLSYDWKCYENDHVTMLMPKEFWGDFSGELGAFASEIAEREVGVTLCVPIRSVFFARPHSLSRLVVGTRDVSNRMARDRAHLFGFRRRCPENYRR